MDEGDDHFYSPKRGADGADPNHNPFDPLPGGDDDGKHEHINLSWDGKKVSTSTQRRSAEDLRTKLSRLESNKDEAKNRVFSRFSKADPSIVSAEIDDFNRTRVYLLKKGAKVAKFPILDDGTIGNSNTKTGLWLKKSSRRMMNF